MISFVKKLLIVTVIACPLFVLYVAVINFFTDAESKFTFLITHKFINSQSEVDVIYDNKSRLNRSFFLEVKYATAAFSSLKSQVLPPTDDLNTNLPVSAALSTLRKYLPNNNLQLEAYRSFDIESHIVTLLSTKDGRIFIECYTI